MATAATRRRKREAKWGEQCHRTLGAGQSGK
jgi:hypothetical protein